MPRAQSVGIVCGKFRFPLGAVVDKQGEIWYIVIYDIMSKL